MLHKHLRIQQETNAVGQLGRIARNEAEGLVSVLTPRKMLKYQTKLPNAAPGMESLTENSQVQQQLLSESRVDQLLQVSFSAVP